jgi:hypothetical protein
MWPKAATMSGAQGQLACIRSFRLRPPRVIRTAACSNSASTFPFTSLRIDAPSPCAPRERLGSGRPLGPRPLGGPSGECPIRCYGGVSLKR